MKLISIHRQHLAKQDSTVFRIAFESAIQLWKGQIQVVVTTHNYKKDETYHCNWKIKLPWNWDFK